MIVARAFHEVDSFRALYAGQPRCYSGSNGVASGSVSFTVGDAASRPSPGLLRSGFIRSVFLSSSKFLRSSSRSPLVRATLLPGFLSSSRHLRRRPRPHHGFRGPLAGCESSQPLASFRPQVFSTSRRLAPSSVSRACFIPQPRPGFLFAPSRGFTRPAAVSSSSLDPAPLPLFRARSPATRLPRARPSTSGLHSAGRCVLRSR